VRSVVQKANGAPGEGLLATQADEDISRSKTTPASAQGRPGGDHRRVSHKPGEGFPPLKLERQERLIKQTQRMSDRTL
tara:strand:- start:2597 stop:2830 length:234 start_codon:yes stop_codon:yes gene_type:complete